MESNQKIVELAYSNFKKGDIAGLLSLMSEKIEWELPKMEGVPIGGKRVGTQQVGGFFSALAENEESLAFEPREFVSQGDKVVALGFYRWRVTTTGKSFESEFAHVFTIQDGKVIRFHEYMDTAVCEKAYVK